MPLLTKILLLSSALTAVAVAQSVPEAQGEFADPCTVLNKARVTGEISYQQVVNCYKSISFNPKDAKTTIDSLTSFYNDIFIFRDMAMTPNLSAPFSLKPVDVLAEVQRIGRKQYHRDFDFHNDLTMLANSFQDAHTAYSKSCYSSNIFLQPLYLYAPVINGHQSIHVYKDKTNSGMEDCEVLTINGRNARSEIQAHADKNTGFSKDAGVRLNFALASHTYWPETKIWLDTPGMFSLRLFLPETPFVDYVLQCKDRKIRRFRGEWTVLPLFESDTFTNKATFVSNLCVGTTNKSDASNKSNNAKQLPLSSKAKATALTDLLAEMYMIENGNKPDSSLKDLPDAKQVAANNNTAAYQLKSMPHVGVLVVPSMEQDSKTEIPAIQGYLQQLAKNGVTNIVIDMTGNFGGEESFASLLPAVFFKTTDKATNSHKFRYRVTPSVQQLAGANLNVDKFTYWSPKHLADMQFKPITTNPFAKDNVDLVFNHRKATYSPWVHLDYDLNYVDSSISYPWSNDPSKIVILTDGQCGSACGMTSDHFVHTHGVKAVGVGGHQHRPLSMFSFPGASVVTTDEYIESFEAVGLQAPIRRLPFQSSVMVGFRYIVSGNDTTPLEYNPKRYPAAMRLQYNPELARHHDKLWTAVAKAAWK